MREAGAIDEDPGSGAEDILLIERAKDLLLRCSSRRTRRNT